MALDLGDLRIALELDNDEFQRGMAEAKVEMAGLSASAQREVTTVSRTLAQGGGDGGRGMGVAVDREFRRAATPRLNQSGREAGGTLARGMELGLLRNSPLIAAAASGALIAGAPALMLGAAVLFGGVAAVADAQNEHVAHSWAQLGQELKAGAQEDAAVLVPVFAQMAQQLGAEFEHLRPLARQAFADMGPEIQDVTSAVTTFAHTAMPGAVRAVSAAQPVFDALVTLAGDLGDGITGLLDGVSAHAPAAARDLAAIGQVLDILLPALGDLLGEGAELADDVLPPLVSVLGLVGDALHTVAPILPEVALGFLAIKAAGALGNLLGKTAAGLENIGAKAMVSVAELTGIEAAGMAAGAGFEAAAGGARGLEAAMGPIGLVLAGLSLVLPPLIDHFSSQDRTQQQVTASAQEMTQALQASKGAIDENVRATAAIQAQKDGLLQWAQTWGISASTVVDAILGSKPALEQVKLASDAYAASFRNASNAQDESTTGAIAFNGIMEGTAGASDKAAAAILGLSGNTDTQVAAQRALLDAINGTADPLAQNNTRLQGLSNTASAASTAVNLLKGALDALSGKAVSMTQAEIGVQQAVETATSSVKGQAGALVDASGKLTVHTQKGAAAQQALIQLASASNTVIATMEQQGATSDQVAAKDAALRAQFVQTAEKMGYTAGQANQLADEILGIPSERRTEINADTSQATAAVAAFRANLESLRDRLVTVTTVHNEITRKTFGTIRNGTTLEAAGGIVHAFAGGGFEPMAGGVAQIVPPNTWRVIGDRVTDDEAYIPINSSARSRAILQQTAAAMGYGPMSPAAAPNTAAAAEAERPIQIVSVVQLDGREIARSTNNYLGGRAARLARGG